MRTLTIPTFGTLLPALGGHFGAILRGAAADGSEDYVLIVSPADSAGAIEDVKWADSYTHIEGTASKTDGQANTAAMAAAGFDLAKTIQALDLGGHTDWYLPAAAELRALSATVPDLFDQSDWYWSSTQYSRPSAWVQDFSDGYSSAFHKDTEFRARAVRKIQLQHFAP